MLLCTRRLCVCKWLESLKLLLHSEHLYGWSPVWTLMWVFRAPDWLNALSHMWHLYGLSPVWTLMCLFRCPDSLNALSHMWHLYGFSPLWILLCETRLPTIVNRLLQTLHSNGFSPEWLRLCVARALLLWQYLPHSVHLYLPVWIFLWHLSVFRDEKLLSHTLHKYGAGLSSCSVISSVLIWDLSVQPATVSNAMEMPEQCIYTTNNCKAIQW